MLARPEFKGRSAIETQIKRVALASTLLDSAILPASSLTSIASLPVHDENVELGTDMKARVGAVAHL